MDGNEILRRVAAAGGDEEGIRARFLGNVDLYALCFRGFFDEESFAALDRCMAAHEYEKAFAPAHALKGLSGNLGLTPFYTAVCDLVEALRARRDDEADACYADVQRALSALRDLAGSDTP